MNCAQRITLGLGMFLTGLVLPWALEAERALGQESGSVENLEPRIPFPFNPQPAESGSTERMDRGFPPILPQQGESGSLEKFRPHLPIPDDPFPAESGSQEQPGGVPPIRPDSFKPRGGNGEIYPPPGGGTHPHAEEGSAKGSERGALQFVKTESPNLILPVVILLAGLFLVGWSLFRMGLFNPFTANLWPKRLELCIEIALRTDDFMTAFNETNFSKCQMSLDALNHLNGRRSILLSNDINAAVNRFVQQAVDCKVSREDEAYQKELNRRYEIVIEALRTGTRQEELSLEVLRSLTKAQGPHRRLREPSGDASDSPNV